MKTKAMPAVYLEATIPSVDFLLTWNCTHIANAEILGRIQFVVTSAGDTIRPRSARPMNYLRENTMKTDAIVSEVRKQRQAVLETYGGDFEKMSRDAVKRRWLSGHRVVSRPARSAQLASTTPRKQA